MKRYLLDTNVVIALLNSRDSPIAQRVRHHQPTDVCISSITAYELFYGAFKSQRTEHNVALIDGMQFPVLEFDHEDAREAGAIRAVLAAQGMPIGPYDLLIAGQAKARVMTLVTHNTREFKRVAKLSIEDWQS